MNLFWEINNYSLIPTVIRSVSCQKTCNSFFGLFRGCLGVSTFFLATNLLKKCFFQNTHYFLPWQKSLRTNFGNSVQFQSPRIQSSPGKTLGLPWHRRQRPFFILMAFNNWRKSYLWAFLRKKLWIELIVVFQRCLLFCRLLTWRQIIVFLEFPIASIHHPRLKEDISSFWWKRLWVGHFCKNVMETQSR